MAQKLTDQRAIEITQESVEAGVSRLTGLSVRARMGEGEFSAEAVSCYVDALLVAHEQGKRLLGGGVATDA